MHSRSNDRIVLCFFNNFSCRFRLDWLVFFAGANGEFSEWGSSLLASFADIIGDVFFVGLETRVLTIIHIHIDYLFIKWNKTPKQPISIISTADPANVSGRITDIMRCLGRSIISSVSLVVNTSSTVLSYCHSIPVMLISYCPTNRQIDSELERIGQNGPNWHHPVWLS